MKKVIFIVLLIMSFASFAFAKQLYVSDFEKDTIGNAPSGWDLGFKGAGNGKVVADPLNASNKIFAATDLAKDKARHDVGGNIWVVGDAAWKDYIVEYDVYFPEDFYIGVLFRFISADKFYLLDRRVAPPSTFDFYKHDAGKWTNITAGAKFDAVPKQWFRFRLVVKGDSFEAYAKAKSDKTPFDGMKALMTGKDATYTAGKFGLYGLIYIDNIVIGETAADMTNITSVEPNSKLSTTWGDTKTRF
jgi:hypothetical protein